MAVYMKPTVELAVTVTAVQGNYSTKFKKQNRAKKKSRVTLQHQLSPLIYDQIPEKLTTFPSASAVLLNVSFMKQNLLNHM